MSDAAALSPGGCAPDMSGAAPPCRDVRGLRSSGHQARPFGAPSVRTITSGPCGNTNRPGAGHRIVCVNGAHCLRRRAVAMQKDQCRRTTATDDDRRERRPPRTAGGDRDETEQTAQNGRKGPGHPGYFVGPGSSLSRAMTATMPLRPSRPIRLGNTCSAFIRSPQAQTSVDLGDGAERDQQAVDPAVRQRDLAARGCTRGTARRSRPSRSASCSRRGTRRRRRSSRRRSASRR